MKTLKTVYSDIPEILNVPEGFVHKKGEIIFILNDEINNKTPKDIIEFFGLVPDFPDRSVQGRIEIRAGK